MSCTAALRITECGSPAAIKLPSIVADGLSLVIVEQDIVQALRAANHVYCLQEGRVRLDGSTLTREAIAAAYFAV